MKTANVLFSAVALLLVSTALPQQAQEKGGTIRVQIHYTGSGTVDQSHKIYVALWDSPDFAKPDTHIMPVAVKSADSKNGTVTFSDVKKSPAYVGAAFDTTGNWDGASGPPPKGASLGMVSSAPPTPDAIDVASGKTAEVTLTFSDQFKMM